MAQMLTTFVDPEKVTKLNSMADYQRANDEFMLKKALAQADLMKSQAAIVKAGEVDADKLGEQAFLKAAQGIEITPQEAAALKYIDAKSPTSAFNPVTGVLEQKPSLLNRAGLTFGNQGGGAPAPQGAPTRAAVLPPSDALGPDINEVYGAGSDAAPIASNEWDAAFQQELAAAAGNPKLQQSLRETYAKKKIAMNEEESKNAGYADRMAMSQPTIDNTQNASMSAKENVLGSVPLVGNFLTTDDYQSAKQAQLDFLNAVLRRESGAAISTGEYKSYAKQYFPQPGDSEQVIAQKAVNRQEALKGVQRSAGPAYTPPAVAKTTAPSGQLKNGTIAENPSTGETIIFMDGAWKPFKGK